MTLFQEPVIFQSTVTFQNTISFNSINIPANAINDINVIAGADISAAKLQHRHSLDYGQKDGTDVVSETKLLYVARAAGTIKRICVRPTTAPTGGDKNYTVDIQKAANGSGSWSSFLTAVITMNSSDTNNTLENGTLIGVPTYAASDAIRVVVTASGSTGSQGQGFIVNIQLDESGV